MSLPARARSLFRNWFSRREIERDLDEEVNAYLDQLIDEKIAAGLSPPAALRAARIELGGVQQVKAQVREHRAGAFLETVWQDIRYGVRGLRKKPGFTVVVAITLALGIGANSTVFSLLDALVLRPLRVENPDELVALHTSDEFGRPDGRTSYPDYIDLRGRDDVLTGLAVSVHVSIGLGVEKSTSPPRPSALVLGEMVSGNYFSLLGVRPALGRGFLPHEDRTEGAHAVAVVSHSLWQRRFGGDPALVGRSVRLNNHPFTVVGVAPADFAGLIRGDETDVWVPTMMHAQAMPLKHGVSPERRVVVDRDFRIFLAVGRLRPGVTVERAQERLDSIAAELRRSQPGSWIDQREQPRAFTLVSGVSIINPQAWVIRFMPLLFTVVGLVLLTACANVSGLMLARASARQKEFTVRLALGSGRARLIRQLLTESLLLAFLGGAAALPLGLWGADLLMDLQSPSLYGQPKLDLGPDWRVVGFIFGVTLLTSALVGLMPALAVSRPDLVTALKDDTGAAGAWPGRARLRKVLVVAQVVLTLVLLIGSGLLLRSLNNARDADLGFDPSSVLAASVDLRLQGYDEARTWDFFRLLPGRVRALPGVTSASMVVELPLGWSRSRWPITVEGYPTLPGERLEERMTVVGADYFEVMRIPVLRGRVFTEDDVLGAQKVAIVNEAFARRYWPGQDPLGKRMDIGHHPPPRRLNLVVVGLVKDGKYDHLGEDPLPFFYLPLFQHYHSHATLVARTVGDSSAWSTAVRNEIGRLDEDLPVFELKTLTQHLAVTMLPSLVLGTVLAVLGLVSLALAALGIYGLVSYSVDQRSREIGIRMALGAGRRHLVMLVVGQGMKLTSIGLAIGLVTAGILARSLSSLLHGVSPIDPATFIGCPLLLAGVALLACYLPARRAAKVHPMTALRHE